MISRPRQVTPACFPTPGLLLRSNDPADQKCVRDFAIWQAEHAHHLGQDLATRLASTLDPARRARHLTDAFRATEDWRYQIARHYPQPDGRYSTTSAERFNTAITDSEPNYFRLGEPERLRHHAVWNTQAQAYQGGAETPASTTMRHAEQLAEARFALVAHTVDIVANTVTVNGQQAPGMRLLRGWAARHAAETLSHRIQARGGDASRIATTGQLIYCASSSESERARVFRHAIDLLATPAASIDAWMRAAYLLYQAPQRKRGADATIRTFLIAAGTTLLERPPVLVHDIDLRAIVCTEPEFLRHLHAHQHVQPTAAQSGLRATAQRQP